MDDFAVYKNIGPARVQTEIGRSVIDVGPDEECLIPVALTYVVERRGLPLQPTGEMASAPPKVAPMSSAESMLLRKFEAELARREALVSAEIATLKSEHEAWMSAVTEDHVAALDQKDMIIDGLKSHVDALKADVVLLTSKLESADDEIAALKAPTPPADASIATEPAEVKPDAPKTEPSKPKGK